MIAWRTKPTPTRRDERHSKLLLFFILFFAVDFVDCRVAQAQLSVLSRGNTDEKWRDAQLDSIRLQLKDSAVKGELKDELEAQAEWLGSWNPGELTTKPLWSSEKRGRYLVEPIIDPSKKATALRGRLLGKDAKPTVKDTKALERLLKEESGDVGVRQLHLHWLDQRHYRKTYPDEIAVAAIRVVGLLEQLKPQTKEVQVAKAFCLYRRGRALAYRELPEVVAKRPIPDQDKHNAKLLGAYNQLTEMVGSGRAEFILLDIRMLRRDHWNGRALALLEGYGGQIEEQWFLKKRRDLLQELGWEGAYREAAEIYASEYPEEVAKENPKKG